MGKPGVWIYLVGDRRRYGRFRILPAGSVDDSDDALTPARRRCCTHTCHNQLVSSIRFVLISHLVPYSAIFDVDVTLQFDVQLLTVDRSIDSTDDGIVFYFE